ncbi:hypothetical protein TCON_1419 [Astathelohania contejeani]|uniref:Telomeric single stranded DNA binding POT1/Cdc13 domain-containing protein n=1 Tax=Astathelohania contejeani TaxID=164912 RepID=A0ABQ7HZ34_9MICR|nr:hypothetical protein TCON_1419 [Thelohania contejeani]
MNSFSKNNTISPIMILAGTLMGIEGSNLIINSDGKIYNLIISSNIPRAKMGDLIIINNISQLDSSTIRLDPPMRVEIIQPSDYKALFDNSLFLDSVVPIAMMRPQVYHHVYGVIVDWLDPIKSRGTDFVTTIDIIDPSTPNSLTVKMFTRRLDFNRQYSIGDIVNIKKIKLISRRISITDHNNEVEILSREGEEISTNLPMAIQKYIYLLRKYYLDNKYKYIRIKQISELEGKEYCDVCGMIIGKQIETNNLVILKLVDYTINDKIKVDNNFNEYPNNMVLIIKLWGKHVKLGLECNINEYYRIKNIRLDELNATMIGYISDSQSARVMKLNENHPTVKKIKALKIKFENKNMSTNNIAHFNTPEHFKNLELVEVKDIREDNRFRKVRMRIAIKMHTPFQGMIYYKCTDCQKIYRTNYLKEDCNLKEEKILKLLVYDKTGECILICKNQLVDLILGNRKYIRHTFMEVAVLIKEKLYLIDINVN